MFPWDWDDCFVVAGTSELGAGQLNAAVGQAVGVAEYAHAYYGHLLDIINTTFNAPTCRLCASQFGGLGGAEFYSADVNYIRLATLERAAAN